MKLDIKFLATQTAEHSRASGKRMPEAAEAVLLRFSLTESEFAKHKFAILSECGVRGNEKKARKTPKKGVPIQKDLFK